MRFGSLLFLLSLLFILRVDNISGQMNGIDSLEKEYAVLPDDSSRISWLSDQIDAFLFNDSLTADFYHKRLIEIAKKTRNFSMKGMAFGDLGYYYSSLSQFSDAIDYCKKGIHLYDSIGDEYNSGKIMLSLARVYSDLGEFDSSLTYYITAEDIFLRHKKYERLLNVYANLNHVYNKIYQNEKSLVYMNKIRDLLPFIKTPKFYAGGLNVIGSTLAQSGQFDSAYYYLSKAKFVAEKNNLQEILYNVIYNQAYTSFLEKDYQKEHLFNLELLKHATSTGASDFQLCECYYKLGGSSTHLKQWKNADHYYTLAYELAIQLKSKIWQRDIIESIATLKAHLGKYNDAYDLLQQYIDLNNQIFSEESNEQANLLNARFDASRKELEIKRLAAENDLQIEKVRKRNILIFSLLAGITLVLLLAYFIIRNFRQQHLIQKQRLEIKDRQIHELEKEKQLVALHATLQGEEAERSRLARDLHDGLGGLLSGIRLKFHSMKGNAIITREGIEQYDHALGLLDSSIKELRHVAHNLMPETLIKFGLKSALEDFCESVSSKTSTVKFSFFGSANRVDENLEIASYRIVQELVNNSFKHASASEIIVQMIQEDNRIHLTVQDNGTGFDTNLLEESTGKGLANIRSRVASFQGSMDIHSTPGVGTETSIEFLL